MSTPTKAPRAPDAARSLDELLAGLAEHSAPGPGVTRLAYDDAWCAAHAWLATQARARGLAASADAAGNLLFHDPALVPADGPHPALLVGSHFDTVVNGGRYDGAYGTIAGLLLATEPRAPGDLPVVGFATCEEEESRFHAAFMGARGLLGEVEGGELHRVSDAQGVTWAAALGRARARGCAAPPAEGPRPFRALFRPVMMLELHIEQGPVLESEGLAIGLVERIAGYRRLALTLGGAARHSGTTPMRHRRDALAAAAEIILAAEEVATRAGEPAVVTAGYVRATPGLANVVPGACEVWLDLRHVAAERLEALDHELRKRAHEIAERRKVTLEIVERSRMEPTALSPALVEAAEQHARAAGVSFRRMASGAAHDAMVFARAGVPTMMVFVPSRGGVSHSPDEFTSPEALAAGHRFAAGLIARLVREGGREFATAHGVAR